MSQAFSTAPATSSPASPLPSTCTRTKASPADAMSTTDFPPPSSPGVAQIPDPPTLTAALRPFRNPESNYAQYVPYLAMTKRFLGEEPSFYPILSLSTAAINTHVGLFARMFHAPEVDMRVPGFLPARLRRAAFLSASSAFNCDYCTAHACAFGDMMLGSVSNQVRRAAPEDSDSLSFIEDDSDAAEKAVKQFAAVAVRRPFYDTAPAIADLARDVRVQVGDRGLEIVKAVVAFVGALNTIMDIQGVTLEADVQRFAGAKMGSGSPWRPGGHHLNASEEATGGFHEEGTQLGWRGAIANVWELIQTIPHAMSAIMFESFTLYKGIPSNDTKLDTWIKERTDGRTAQFLSTITGTELKRAFCFGFRENVLADPSSASGEQRQWTLTQRLAFLYTFGKVTDSEDLRNGAMELLLRERKTVSADDVVKELEDFASGEAEQSPAEVAARRLVTASAERTDNISKDLVAEIASACSPEAIMELASLVSFFEMWRRLALLFSIDGAGSQTGEN